MTLEQIADELYGLPLDEFTAARNARAKAEKAAKSLPKPSAAAWAMNQFARSSPQKLEQVFALGAQLREAQDDLDAASLRKLGQQRRALLSALAKEISTTGTMQGDIEQTLQAAMADEDAAAAVASGRLVRTLESDGITPADLEGAVAVPVASARRPAPAKKAPSAAARKKAQAALDAATADRAKADADAAELEAKVNAAGEKQQKAQAQVERLEAEFAAARATLEHATDDVARIRRAKQAAEERVERAEAAEERAREKLDDLG